MATGRNSRTTAVRSCHRITCPCHVGVQNCAEDYQCQVKGRMQRSMHCYACPANPIPHRHHSPATSSPAAATPDWVHRFCVAGAALQGACRVVVVVVGTQFAEGKRCW